MAPTASAIGNLNGPRGDDQYPTAIRPGGSGRAGFLSPVKAVRMTSRSGGGFTWQTLRPHPQSFCAAVTQFKGGVVRPRVGGLLFAYIIRGNVVDLAMAPLADSARTDELWRDTCFEAFIRGPSSTEYYELNFAPSTQWAAYKFSSYRSEMRVATEIDAPRITVEARRDHYMLQASLVQLDEALLPASGAGAANWHVGLSAVIKETSGRRSYWALAHPSGKPDFHHVDCFALEVSQGWRP